MTQKTIAILFGGCSTEYEVSLQSAHAVITHLDQEKYRPVLLGIPRQGEWRLFEGDVDRIPKDDWQKGAVPALISPDRGVKGALVFRGRNVETIPLDGAFPVLHGKNGEDGTVQGLLRMAGIPVIGCGVLASALGMDKERAHTLAQAAGVDVPRSVILWGTDELDKRRDDIAALGLPLFVKPVRAGSSFGITRVTEPSQLPAAVEEAFRHDDRVILEESIPGFEVGCAVMGGRVLTLGEVDEIELSQGFFDYTEKYTLKTSAIHMPARVPGKVRDQVRSAAGRIYRALGCSGFARVDLFLTPEGRIVFNEVNTIPGFTSHSRYPNMMKGIGLDFSTLVNRLVEEGLGE